MQNMAVCYKRLSFSNDEEYKLIEFIKNHPALWDCSDVDYGNNELRKLYWKTLATNLGKTVFECRRKWRFVRDYYIHKRRRYPDSTPARDGKYYNLQFLNKIKTCPRSRSEEDRTSSHRRNSPNPKQLNEIEVSYVVESDEEVDYEYLEEPAVLEKNKNMWMGSGDDRRDFESRQETQDEYVIREQYENELAVREQLSSSRHQNMNNAIENHENDTQKQSKSDSETNDDGQKTLEIESSNNQNELSSSSSHDKVIDLFFESMAATVKAFPPQFVAEAKFKVFMAINEIEAKVFRKSK